MRKFVKTVAVLALAVSVLSTSAFAALRGDLTVNNGTYSLEVTGAAAGEQVTLLATDATSLANVTDANIWYIDQNGDGNFSNFQLKDGNLAGKELFFYAASTSLPAEVVASVQNWVVTLVANKATVEIGEEVLLTAGIAGGTYEGNATWTVSGTGASVTADETLPNEAATFVATAAGTYTVTFNPNLEGVAAKTVDIVVEEPGFQIDAVKKDIINTDSTHEAAVEQNGIGVALTVNVPVNFQKIVWVFTDGTDRYYSDSMPFTGVAGSVTIGAAAPNGNNISNTTAKINVTGFDAIFLVDEDTAYFTNEDADAGNKDRVVTE